MNHQELEQICSYLGLGDPENLLKPVSGGLIHKMWQVKTNKGWFAIKELSQLINFNDDTKKAYERSEELARSFQQAGIAAVAAIGKNGSSLIELKTSHFLCYPWFDGKTLTLGEISQKHAIKIAKVLAKIHQVSLAQFGSQHLSFDTCSNELISSLCGTALTQYQAMLLRLNQRYQAAIPVLEKTGLISHTDLDPKNVLWDSAENPYLIDWESARAINVTHDIIQLALDWTGCATCSINMPAFQLMLQSYQEAGGKIDDEQIEDALYAILGNAINWLVFNIKRKFNLSLNPDEHKMAQYQVETTLKSMHYLHDNLALIMNAAKL